MLSKKIPLHYLLVSTFVASIFTFLYIKHTESNASSASDLAPFISKVNSSASTTNANIDTKENNENAGIVDNSEASYGIKRLGGYRYIAPIISAGPMRESEKYSELKSDIVNIINKEKKSGLVTSVSVYLKNFQSSNWTVINPDERYSPGSLLKVAVLITYLRMSEYAPNLLSKELVYHGNKRFHYPTQHFLDDSVKEGHKYTVTELLRYMIKYSDNKATLFLENNMDTSVFKKEFTDLGLRDIHFDDPEYTLTVKEYSRLMKALYNAGYLGARNSEFATSMLTESRFKEGLMKELPATVTVAHKFGEAGDQNTHELHESGIVYVDGNPYLLTVMTRGTDWNKLSETISHISKAVYNHTVPPTDGHETYSVDASK